MDADVIFNTHLNYAVAWDAEGRRQLRYHIQEEGQHPLRRHGGGYDKHRRLRPHHRHQRRLQPHIYLSAALTVGKLDAVRHAGVDARRDVLEVLHRLRRRGVVHGRLQRGRRRAGDIDVSPVCSTAGSEDSFRLRRRYGIRRVQNC